MNTLRKLALLWLTIACSCSSVRVVKTEPSDNFTLANYKTFGFVNVDATGDVEPQGNLFRSQIENLKGAVARELQERGLKQSDERPDLLVNIGVAVDEKVQTRQTSLLTDPPNYIGQRRYTWKSQEVEVGRYRQGTVDVHLVDRERNAMVWRGIVEGILPNKSAKIADRIEESMARLFDRLPKSST